MVERERLLGLSCGAYILSRVQVLHVRPDSGFASSSGHRIPVFRVASLV